MTPTQDSYIGNTTASQAVKAGSTPVSCSKKEVTFVYQKLLLFLSKPQAWYIISALRAVYIISPFGAVYHLTLGVHKSSCGLMIYNTLC